MRGGKTYLSIGDTARILGVSPSLLRNWEKIGLITPIRSQGRYRLFSREVLAQARHVLHLRKVERLNPHAILREQKRSRKRTSGGTSHRRVARIGTRLSRLRHEQGLTLTQAAQKAGISAGFLSAIERHQANPSVATFHKLARLYQTNVLSFFGTGGGERQLIRANERRSLKTQPGIRIESLALGDHVMQVELWRLKPGTGSGESYQHEGEEFAFVLRGRLEIWLDEVERYILGPGDSLYFRSTQAHRFRNPGDKETEALWVNTPPSF
jgi:transcriptional regulator with XRE-family HTH domain